MTVFKYQGRTRDGKLAKGNINATSKKMAISKLREKGINPRIVEESSSILHKEIDLGERVKVEDFVMYCRQFATLIRSGISIVESTNILSRQVSSKPLKRALEMVEDDIRSGVSFSSAVAKQPKVFPEIFVSMMMTGEATGNFDETLERLATSMEKQYQLRKKIRSTMTYPVILLVLMLVVVVFMLLFIVPTFVSSFATMGAELPTITLFTLALSDWLRSFWWLLLVGGVGIIVTFQVLFRTNPKFHYTVHYMLLRMPVIGPVLQKSVISRLMRNLSALFSSAVPILQALVIAEKVTGNPVISKIVVDARQSLENGNRLSDPLEKSWLFPPLVTSMTYIGETTGSLDYMLEKVAEFYEKEVDIAVETLKSLIEPVMLLILALLVGVIVAAILMPMFSLYEQM